MVMNIGVRHLRAVVAVADRASFSAAANDLLVAQSALSRTVLDVEHRVGTKLFERTTRSVRLTRDGEEFVVLARQVLAEFDGAMAHFGGYLSGARGSVSVAALPSLAATLLPQVLAAFRSASPEVTISVADALSGEVLDQVVSGKVDMAVTVALEVPPRLQSTRIATDRFACVFPEGHPYSERRRLTWADLEGEPFVAFDRASSIRDYADRTLDDLGITTGPMTEARNIGAVAGLVAAGLGVSVVPGLVLPMMRFAGVRHRVLGNPVVDRDIRLIRDPLRPMAPAAAGLVTIFDQAESHGIELPAGAAWWTRPEPP